MWCIIYSDLNSPRSQLRNSWNLGTHAERIVSITKLTMLSADTRDYLDRSERIKTDWIYSSCGSESQNWPISHEWHSGLIQHPEIVDCLCFSLTLTNWCIKHWWHSLAWNDFRYMWSSRICNLIRTESESSVVVKRVSELCRYSLLHMHTYVL